MSSTGLHEDPDKLRPETTDLHRAIVSLMEELEAVAWYGQRIDAATDPELRAILERHFASVKILSSKSGGRLSEDCDSGQKMVALCR